LPWKGVYKRVLRKVETALELSPENLPDYIQPAGMDLKRRWYLYEYVPSV